MKHIIEHDNLVDSYKALVAEKPTIRLRDAATFLNTSEAELLASEAIKGVKLLKNDPKTLLERLRKVGKVMSLTRNDECILEHKGQFQSVNVTQNEQVFMGLTIGEIEMRCFLKEWKYTFSVSSFKDQKESHSIQVFDHSGTAILKIFEQRHTDSKAFKALIDDLASEAPDYFEPTVAYSNPSYEHIKNQAGFAKSWGEMTDPHQFVGLLKQHKAARFDALAAVKGVYTHQLAIGFVEECLNYCAQEAIPIMIFTGNKGNIQIHQDVVKHIKIVEMGENKWINVLDPNFNMHLNEHKMASVWHVEKPSESGPIHSIEIFNKDNELITQLFGLRKMNNPQNEKWVSFIKSYLKKQGHIH